MTTFQLDPRASGRGEERAPRAHENPSFEAWTLLALFAMVVALLVAIFLVGAY